MLYGHKNKNSITITESILQSHTNRADPNFKNIDQYLQLSNEILSSQNSVVLPALPYYQPVPVSTKNPIEL